MDKKTAIKIALREALAKNPGNTATISRPETDTVSVDFGSFGLHYTLSPFDDSGDLSTESEFDDIYLALSVIVDEHNG